jgi:hypothetical protein
LHFTASDRELSVDGCGICADRQKNAKVVQLSEQRHLEWLVVFSQNSYPTEYISI